MCCIASSLLYSMVDSFVMFCDLGNRAFGGGVRSSYLFCIARVVAVDVEMWFGQFKTFVESMFRTNVVF